MSHVHWKWSPLLRENQSCGTFCVMERGSWVDTYRNDDTLGWWGWPLTCMLNLKWRDLLEGSLSDWQVKKKCPLTFHLPLQEFVVGGKEKSTCTCIVRVVDWCRLETVWISFLCVCVLCLQVCRVGVWAGGKCWVSFSVTLHLNF